MKFVPVRELRNNSAQVWKSLESEGELVLTSNGHPIALVTPVSGENLEDQIRAVRRSRAILALEKIRSAVQAQGLDRMSGEELDRIISEVRQSQKAQTRSSSANRS